MHEKPLNTPSPPPTPPPLLLPSFPGKANPSLMMDPPPPPPLPADAAGKPKKPPPPPAAAALRPPDQQSLRCPRCDSPNTKFCYYNNYSLTQPRHFCKTCRRYWTKGGALRNVPIGGGCRKAKKSKSSSSSSSATATSPASTINSSSSSARLPIDSLKFFSPPASAFDFQLGMLPFHSAAAAASHLVPFADYASSPNYHVSDLGVVSGDGHHSAIAASIESLSNINQDLHWKLQQQRLAMLFGGGCGEGVKDSLPAAGGLGDCQAMESISFQVADGPKGEAACGARADHAATTTAWFLDNPYTTSLPNSNPRTTTTANAAGIKAWNEMHHFTALP